MIPSKKAWVRSMTCPLRLSCLTISQPATLHLVPSPTYNGSAFFGTDPLLNAITGVPQAITSIKNQSKRLGPGDWRQQGDRPR